MQGRVFEPEVLRELMRAPATGTPSADPAQDRIGVMPDLRAILEQQRDNARFRPRRDEYVSLVHVLIGLIDDTPGLIWVPGKRPFPVDPGWGRLVAEISPSTRDLLAGLAVRELAGAMSDAAARTTLIAAATDAMHRAVDRIARDG